MGRYLPWRDDPADGTRPRKRIKSGLNIENLKSGKEQEVVFREDEYMRDGIKNDDRYIMVEDELLQIAKSYTAKLHSAELARLQAQIALRKTQKLAASQSSQPRITGSIPKQRQVVLHRRAHDAAVRKAVGIKGNEEEEEPYNPKFSSQSLGRLMTTSATRIDSTLPLPLTLGKAIKPATRAAAGFTKASFKKASSSQISPSQLRSSQIAKEVHNDNDERESDESDDEDLDFVPRRSSSIRIPPKMTPIEKPTSSHASDKRIPLPKSPHTSTHSSKLLSSSPQGFKKPSLLSSSPPPRPSRALTFSAHQLVSKPIPTRTPKLEAPTVNSDSDNDYADAEQAARWRRRSLPRPIATPSSTNKSTSTPLSISKAKPIIVDSDSDDDYANAEQAARFRRRQLSEAQKSSAGS
ncbi:hypothetical protein TWF281_010165 [Arthrobotrys megalospora]